MLNGSVTGKAEMPTWGHQSVSRPRGFDLYAWRLALCLLACCTFACKRPIPLTPYTAYVVNQQSATLAAVNLADFTVTASLPVSPQPQQVLVRPGARQLYVVSALGKIDVVEFPRLRQVATLEIGSSAKDLAFSPGGDTAYVLDPEDHAVVAVDCGSGGSSQSAAPKVTGHLPVAGTLADMALSPDGKTLVVSSRNPDQLTFLSTATRRTLGTVAVGQAPGPMVILPDSSKVFVADTGEDKISAVDMASRTLLSHIEIGTRPTTLLLKPDGGEIFVLAADAATMVIVDAFHDNVEQTFPLGRDPVTGVFRSDMGALFIANAGDGSVLALDPQGRQPLASTHVGMEPVALALTPDQRLLVVADRAASSLAIMHADLPSLNNDRSVLITSVAVGGSPVDVVIPNLVAGQH